MNTLDPQLRDALRGLGVASGEQLQRALGCSQPTLSRRVAAAGGQVLVLGRGRSTRYALPQAILGQAAQQPLHWVDEAGLARRWGTLSLAEGGWLLVQADGLDTRSRNALPWFLSPLKAEGFLGRSLARALAPLGLPGDPAAFTLEQQLAAALYTPDAPGALVLGDPAEPRLAAGSPGPDPRDYAALADAAARTLPTGSSAGGEQAKFLGASPVDGHPTLVKFSPPLGTPFGDRWHDLLHAEHLALSVLAEHGVPVAQSRIVALPGRTALESRRFDRTTPATATTRAGRRHAVPLWAVHEAFVGGPMQHWAATCEALARQRRLGPEVPEQVQALRRFGRLIGNTDMHFGNLSLAVDAADVARGRFTLAPLYDMLPMRWRPQPATGALDALPFPPEPEDLASAAAPLAAIFWSRLAESPEVGRAMRQLAREMHRRMPSGA